MWPILLTVLPLIKSLMKNLFAILIILFPFISFSQDAFPFIARDSSEFINAVHDENIEDVYVNSFDKIEVKKKNGNEKFKMGSIWGFRNKKGVPYRSYEGQIYRIEQIGDFTVYTGQEQNYIYYSDVHYFSRGLSGDIYKITGYNLKKIFAKTNPKFLKLVKGTDYDKYDKANHSFKIVELYRQSLL